MGIPERLRDDAHANRQPRERAALEFYIKRMSEDLTLTAADVSHEYRICHHAAAQPADINEAQLDETAIENSIDSYCWRDNECDHDYPEQDHEADKGSGFLEVSFLMRLALQSDQQ